jgi:hypothetical protein
MATLVLSTIGTAIGGPIGSALGAFLGNQIDSAVFGGGNREGPRLKELAVTTSSYGQPIPRYFGRMRAAGTIIWSTELNETSSKEGGGKGRPSTRSYSYSASFAVALSSTPIARIGRIWADGNLLRGVAGDLKVEGAMRAYRGTGDHIVDPLIAAAIGASAPAFRDIAYVVFEDLQLADFGNRIPALTFEIFGLQDAVVSLSEIVPGNAVALDNVQLDGARGFADEGGALIGSLSALERVFPLTCVTTAEGLRFASATSLPTTVPVLAEQLSEFDNQASEARQRQRGETLGQEPLAVRYYDEDRDYQPSVQRALGLRPDGREAMVDLPATMTASGARGVANANAQRARWLDEKIVWRMGEFDPRIGAGSVVRIPDTPGYWLVRHWEWFERGIELSLERLAPSLDTSTTSDAGLANTPIDAAAPPTTLCAIETPPDDIATPSYSLIFAAASAENSGWRGASLFVEQGATLASVGSSVSIRAVVGTLTVPLRGDDCALLLPNASLEVELMAEDLAFASTDTTGLAMGANRLMVGGEVLQFLTAESIAPRRWRLRGLLRGRAGTEDFATIGHDVGALVVSLDDRLTPLDPSLVPPEASTRIAAIGRGDTEPVYAALQNAGLSRRPPMPVSCRKTIAADGTWRFFWTRRSRGHWRWTDASEVPLVEELEAYTAGFGPIASPNATWSLTEPSFDISEASRLALLENFGPGPLWVRQVGTYNQSASLLLATTI